MNARQLHVILLLIPHPLNDGVGFLLYPHDQWSNDNGEPFLTLPAKKSVAEPFSLLFEGTPVDEFVDRVATEDLGLQAEDYVFEQELDPVEVAIPSPTHQVLTDYQIYPVVVWVDPARHDHLVEQTQGQWLWCHEALEHPNLSPTSRAVLATLLERNEYFVANPPSSDEPRKRVQAEALRRVLSPRQERPTMDGLALKWLSRNRNGVRHLTKGTLDELLDAGNRAFNLRVADPYLRYQMQGLGFTWSFFTHKDKQDCHVHGAPVVEIYGILEGRLEVWWKPYYDRGTSAWNHRILEAGDWLEVDSLQCHIVRWLTEGKGIVFKAGPGPLAEVGKLGVKGKTPCHSCPCMKPAQVEELETAKT